MFVVLFAAAFLILCGVGDAFAQAAPTDPGVEEVARAAEVEGTTDLPVIIGRLINIALGFVGIILLVIIIYAGFLWMTAGGDADQVKKAQQWIKNAVIGLLIIAASFAIVRFILGFFGEGGVGGGITGVGMPPGGGFATAASALGKGVIESHYPMRDARDVPRNTAIIVTFKQPVKISSIIAGYNDNGTPGDRTDDTVTEGLNDTAVKIFRMDAGIEGAFSSDRVRVRFTDDRKTFVFRPVEYLGSATVNVDYTVKLMPGLDGVLLEYGATTTPAFVDEQSDGYEWSFQTGTIIDTTPPKVISAFPRTGGGPYCKNVVVHVQFNEAVDPTASTGFIVNGGGFENIKLSVGEGDLNLLPLVDGEWKISNQYKTVEFVPGGDPCAVNTCGEDVFCLPGSASVNVLIQAATLEGSGPTAQWGAAGFDGVVDVASNSLDGNADGETQGKPNDNYYWRFTTRECIDLTVPSIELTYPSSVETDYQGRENADPFLPVRVRFDSIIQPSSFNSENAYIDDVHEPDIYDDTFWFTTGQDHLTAENVPVESVADVAVKSDCYIMHRMFATSTLYDPYLLSNIRNAYQNCFYEPRYEDENNNECLGTPNCCLNEPSDEFCDTVFGTQTP